VVALKHQLVLVMVGVLAVIAALSAAVATATNYFGVATQSNSLAIRLGGTDPGSLVSATPMPSLAGSLLSAGVRGVRVVYRSTEGDSGASTVVSGTVFRPAGSAPAGGWPVVALGHATMGINSECAPSLSPQLLGLDQVVAALTQAGYAVALPDFQGLGSDGVHPYSDSRTAGLNIIDAVRALRATFSDVSTRWAAFGQSQGGGAVWAADEQAATYAPELQLLGAVALSPAADVSGLVSEAEQGTLTPDQRPALQWVLASLGRLHPELNLNDFRHGAAAEYWDTLSACSGPLVHQREQVISQLGAQDLAPATPQAGDQLRGLLQRWALPQRQLSAPLSIVYGTDDTVIDTQWTTDAINRACALGDTNLVWTLQPGKGHNDIDWTGQIQWLRERFAGKPLNGICPAL
jgi:alpha-beta hydrolase superfamily lysophospholipase